MNEIVDPLFAHSSLIFHLFFLAARKNWSEIIGSLLKLETWLNFDPDYDELSN